MTMILAFFRKPLGWAIGAILLIGALWWAYSALTRDSRTEARLGRNQAEAALGSGKDAVDTVGKAGARETELDRKANDAKSKVDAAPDAAGADAAGRDGLCGISDYFCSE